jgi:Spy/CpxP family protein refolding chaperone
MLDKIKVQPIALILVLMLIALIMGLIAYSAYASNFGSGDRRGFGRTSNKPRENKSLNLTPEQEAQLRSLRDKFLEETAFLRAEIPRKLSELRILWADPKPDKDQINSKKKEIIDLYNQLQIKATDNRLLAQSFLSPEQAEKLPVFGLRLDIEPNFDIEPGLPSGRN